MACLLAAAVGCALVLCALTLPGVATAADCGPDLNGSFATPPINANIAAQGEVDCYDLTNVEAGDRVLVDATANNVTPRWTLVDGSGAIVCDRFFNGSPCLLTGTPGWSLQVYDYNETSTFSYTLAARRLTDPDGCTPLGDPAVWSFTAPRVNGAISGGLDARCYAFTRTLAEGDGSYWFQSVRSAGTLQPQWRVFDPSGAQACQRSSPGFTTCPLLAEGQHIVVIDDGGQTQTGSFYLTAKRLTDPHGCTALRSASFDAAPTAGSIATAGEIDCHAISDVSSGDVVRVGFTASNGNGNWTVVDASGEAICSGFGTADCRLTGSGGWSLLVYEPYGPDSFDYAVVTHRLTDPEGCTSLGDPAVWSFTAPRVDGSIAGTLGGRCYTFTRSPGEPDGAYMFRAVRATGALNPRWSVHDAAGNQLCGDYSGLVTCSLLASGQFTLVVRDDAGTNTGSFFLTAKRLTRPQGCSALPSVAFDAAPTSGSIDAAEVDCHALPGMRAGDRLYVRMTTTGGSSRWSVVDAAGEIGCESSSSADCTLSGSGGWSLLVYDYGGSGSFGYTLAARRLTDPQGCAPLGDPAVWSFTAPRLNGTIERALETRCYTFSRSFADGDAAYWFQSVRSAGTLQPHWRVLDPSGNTECQGVGADFASCTLLASGEHAVIVDDNSGTDTGAFYLTAKRLTDPQGCSTLRSVSFGLGPIAGNLSTAGEADCYLLPASSGDLLTFSRSGAVDQIAVVDAAGVTRCRNWWGVCTIDGGAPYALFAFAGGTATGSYQFSARCENVPCGQSDTAITDAVPNRVGPGESTTILLRGRDLDLLESVELVRGADTRQGALQEPSPDGRAVESRFDLSRAATGSWELRATFIDGTTRILPAAVTVEALQPASISVEMVGRDVFRAGRPTNVTLEVHNAGNVDGMGVPVVLSGIPLGSTVEPGFAMRTPQGNADNPRLAGATFDQQHDTLTFDDGLAVPLLLPRVPAGGTKQLEFSITAPVQGADYVLRAAAGQCLGGARPGSSPASVTLAGEVDLGPSCAEDFSLAVISFIPFGDCFNAGWEAASIVSRSVVSLFGLPQDDPVGMVDGVSFGLSVAGCGLDATGVGGVAKRAVQAGGLVTSGAQLYGDCWVSQSESELPQRQVAAFDPNDILGPIGTGEARYIPGDEPLAYRVLFENLPRATAPAQGIAITDQLNPALVDPETVLFEDVRFGATLYRLPYPEHAIDETLDLRPAQNLLVHVTAGVSMSGLVRWELQAIDPDTLEPPDDPLAGFLPPNQVSPEGEGSASFSVQPRALTSGTVVPNAASIVFDANAPILTPTWTNTVDKLAPTARVSATPAGNPASAEVAWSGSDDAAGVALYEIRVSKDGAPFTLWRTADTADSATFTAESTGTYAFRVLARDGAGNVGQSTQAAVALTPPTAPPPPPPPSGSGGQTSAQPPASSGTPRQPTVTASAACVRARGARVQAQKRLRGARRKLASAHGRAAKRRWARAVRQRTGALRRTSQTVRRTCG
ncbi:MAG TPA: hypothetical protein VGO48_00180 [Conexibacter sp.]|jgi:hypothetical protein|nr:hypothetical protein [Conexibacter sp.]